jgi:hypothetical protein
MDMNVRLVLLSLLVAGSMNVPRAASVEFRHVGSGAGFDVSFVVPSRVNPFMGAGGLLDFAFSLGDIGALSIHPNVEMWFSFEDNHRWNGHTWDDFAVFEIDFNGDFRYYFPLPERVPVRPFAGNGFGFAMTVESGDDDELGRDDSEVDVDPLFNFFGGIDFPFSSSVKGFVEIKAKLGDYDVFRTTFGMIFGF